MSGEFKPAQPEQYDRIAKVADRLIDLAGVRRDQGGFSMESVTIAVGDPEMAKAGDDQVLPTISITRPVDNSNTAWSHEIVYGMQDADKSKHVLIGKESPIGRSAIVSPYNEGNADLLTQDDANRLIFDLETQIPPENKSE